MQTERMVQALQAKAQKPTLSEEEHGEALALLKAPDLVQRSGKLAAWRHDYNQHRPHSSLRDMTPAQFAALALARPKESPPLGAGFPSTPSPSMREGVS